MASRERKRNEGRLFQAGQIYEQIELLSDARSRQEPLSSDARLISQLQQVYTEDREIVTYVWEKLDARVRADRPPGKGWIPPERQRKPGKDTSSVRSLCRVSRPRRFHSRLLELSAAFLLVSALVASMVVLFQKSHRVPGPTGKRDSASSGYVQP
jgi:hypothetical protein